MADSNKDHVTTILTRFEQVGLLPKGKTADLLENYDFVVQQMEDEAKAVADAAIEASPETKKRRAPTPPSDAA